MVSTQGLVKRRSELLTALERLEDNAAWRLIFEAYLTVCDELERRELTPPRVKSSRPILSQPVAASRKNKVPNLTKVVGH